jgi:hypothetical protein
MIETQEASMPYVPGYGRPFVQKDNLESMQPTGSCLSSSVNIFSILFLFRPEPKKQLKNPTGKK